MDDLINGNIKVEDFINELILDQKRFSDFVYTPLDEAIQKIKSRQQDENIKKYTETYLGNIPGILEGGFKAVLFRNITSPNYETIWFSDVMTTFKELDPVFLEYTKDKFTNRNLCKFALGKIALNKGKNKNNEPIFEYQKIIDINISNCQPFSSIKTLWDQPLVDFHHDLFLKDFPDFKNKMFDLSDWVEENGKTAKEYYKSFLLLFIKHGILFENLIFKSDELVFAKEVILPAFIDILIKTGVKPLIVSLEPTEIEDGNFWQAYPVRIKDYLDEKTSGI